MRNRTGKIGGFWTGVGKQMVAMMTVSAILLTGCSNPLSREKPDYTAEVDATEDPEDEVTGMSQEDASYAALDYLRSMTLEEKVGQLFVVNLEQLDRSQGDWHEFRELTQNMKSSLAQYPVGGVVLFSRNIDTRKQTHKLLRKLQKYSNTALFTAVDEEGGEVARIAKNSRMKTTVFPTIEEIGKTKDANYVYNMGRTIGSEIRCLGFNVDFAPVADVKTNDLNTEIGTRSFGSDPKKVSEMVEAFVTGIQEKNICSTLKHFPGQGSSTGDTHQGSVDLDSSISQMRKTDFVPFKAGIEAGADFVMVSHISVSRVTESSEPASMSELIMKTILRDELEYSGLIITDAFDMASITDTYTAAEAAVKALKSGVDIILMPQNLVEAYQGVLDAVQDKKLDQSQIDDSVMRILQLKFKRGILTLDDLARVTAQETPQPTATPKATVASQKKAKKDKTKKSKTKKNTVKKAKSKK